MNIDLITNLISFGNSEAASDNFHTVELYNNGREGEKYEYVTKFHKRSEEGLILSDRYFNTWFTSTTLFRRNDYAINNEEI
jgi:hypothetical protein